MCAYVCVRVHACACMCACVHMCAIVCASTSKAHHTNSHAFHIRHAMPRLPSACLLASPAGSSEVKSSTQECSRALSAECQQEHQTTQRRKRKLKFTGQEKKQEEDEGGEEGGGGGEGDGVAGRRGGGGEGGEGGGGEGGGEREGDMQVVWPEKRARLGGMTVSRVPHTHAHPQEKLVSKKSTVHLRGALKGTGKFIITPHSTARPSAPGAAAHAATAPSSVAPLSSCASRRAEGGRNVASGDGRHTDAARRFQLRFVFDKFSEEHSPATPTPASSTATPVATVAGAREAPRASSSSYTPVVQGEAEEEATVVKRRIEVEQAHQVMPLPRKALLLPHLQTLLPPQMPQHLQLPQHLQPPLQQQQHYMAKDNDKPRAIAERILMCPRHLVAFNIGLLSTVLSASFCRYGVATTGRLLKNSCLFFRISSLL